MADITPAARQEDQLAEGEYIVDRLLDRRKRGNRVEFLVKWRDYPIEQ